MRAPTPGRPRWWRRALASVAAATLAATCTDPVTPASPAAGPLLAANATAAAAAAPAVAWLAPLGTAAAQAGANDTAAADLSIVVCEAQGSACRGTPVATFTRTAGPAGQLLRADAALGAFAADFDLMRAAFTTRKTYHVQLRQGAQVLGAVDVDLVRGRWAPTVPGTLAPLRSAATLPIRVRLARALRLNPAEASPLAAVTVAGLPAGYATTSLAITVAGRTAVLTRDLGDTTWTFLVPGGTPAGAATVVFPASGGADARSATLTVVPTTFVGGSPAAALQTFDRDLADVQAALGRAQPVLTHPGDSVLLRRVTGVSATLGHVRAYVASLPASEREQLAAFYSANRPRVTQVSDMLIELADDAAVVLAPIPAGLRRAPGPTLQNADPSAKPPSGLGLPGVLGGVALAQADDPSDVVARCEKFVRYMKVFDALEATVSWVNAVLQTAAVVPIPHLRAAAAAATAADLLLDLVGAFLNTYPALLAPVGLQLEFSPARVAAGGTGTMRASVELRSKGGMAGTVITASLSLILDRFEAVRRLIVAATPRVRESIRTAGLETVLVRAEDLLNDIAANAVGRVVTERRPIALDLVAYTHSINGDLWAFTGPNTGLFRSWAANRPAPKKDQLVTQDGAVNGAEEGCSAVTGAATHASGINGFVVAGEEKDSTPPPGGGATGSGSTSGDPHLVTMDGLAYDFQGVGDYVLARSTAAADFEVQVRHRRAGSAVSVTEAAAFRVGADVVNVFPATDQTSFDLLINDEVVGGTTALSRKLPGGGTVLVANGLTTVSWPDGSAAKIRLYAVSLFPLVARAGALEGLLGNFDGNRANDIRIRNGAVLDSALDPRLYTDFRQSWRAPLGSAASLFRRGPDLWDPAFPANRVTLASFSAAEVERARGICRAAGAVTPSVIDGCALDILVTGNNGWATIAAAADPNVLRVTVAPALGYVNTNESVQFAAHVSSATNPAVTWTATGGTVAAAGPNTVTYTAPGTPGQYTITATSVQNGTAVSRAVVNVGTLGALRLNQSGGGQVGAGLRSTCYQFNLPVPARTALAATVTSSDGTMLQVASNPDCGSAVGVPGATATLPVTDGGNRVSFVTDGLEGKSGPVTVSVRVPGYMTTDVPVAVVLPTLSWAEYPRSPTTTDAPFYYPLRVGVGAGYALQAIRPGGRALTVRMTSLIPARAGIGKLNGPSGSSGTAVIVPGQSSTPGSGSGALYLVVHNQEGYTLLDAVAVDGTSAGPAQSVTVNVAYRWFRFGNSSSDATIGTRSSTQVGYFGFRTTLEPTTVTLTSSNGEAMQVAFDTTCEGAYGPAGTSATHTFPAGSTRFCFVVYGKTHSYNTLTATAPGYTSDRHYVLVRPAATASRAAGPAPP